MVECIGPGGEEETFRLYPETGNSLSADGNTVHFELNKFPIRSKLLAQGEQGMKSKG